MIERSTLKDVAERALDLLAEEHPLGHQASKARRYVLRTRSGTMELMIQRDPQSPINIWMLQDRAAGLIGKTMKPSFSPSSKLYKVHGSGGKLNYGRHSALEKMPELGLADLVYFAPKDFTELGIILDYLTGL